MTWLPKAGTGGGAPLSDDAPLPDGTADPGVSSEASRADHVHPTSGGETGGAWGILEIADPATTASIAHGQTDAELGEFQVGKNGPLSAASDWWWTADADDVTVTIDQPAGANIPFVWSFTRREAHSPPPFDPADLPGLVAWLEADSLTLADNDPVLSWNDLSGNGNHATAFGSAKPVYKTAVLNGLPVVRWDGTDRRLTFPRAFANTAASGLTVAAVFSRSDGNRRGLLSTRPSSTAATGWLYGPSTSSNLWYVHLGASPTVGSASGTLPNATWAKIAAVRNGLSVHHWINGTAEPAAGLSGFTASTLAGTWLGGESNQNYLAGDLAAVIICEAVLTPAELAALEGWWDDKYGL